MVSTDSTKIKMDTTVVKPEKLYRLSVKLLLAAGASTDESKTVARHLLEANLQGVDSHGILRLFDYLRSVEKGEIKTHVSPRIVKNGKSVALVDGRWGFGQTTALYSMRLAIEKASSSGIGSVGVFNCNHVGRLAYYSSLATEKHMIGLVFANADPFVAPWGGRIAVLGTNPLSIAIPTSAEPIVIDLSTSVVPEGKVRTAFLKGDRIPEGWIIGPNGETSTNPADLYAPPLPPEGTHLSGALLPLGGYKGYALALAIDAMAGVLTGAGFDGNVTRGNGLLLQAIDVRKFISARKFENQVNELIRKVKEAPKARGFDEILIPGEPESRERKKREKMGIPLTQTILRKLEESSKKYKVDLLDLLK